MRPAMTVLGIWAHPDDEVFVSGGLMADAVRRGARVVCVHMTRGEAGLSYRQRTRPEFLARTRERELRSSLACVGVREQRFFGYPDGGLAEIVGEEAVGRLHDLLVELHPDAVVTFGPDGFTGHPDHQALSAWVTAAFELWDHHPARLYHSAVSTLWKDAFAPSLDEFDFFWPGHPVAVPDVDMSLRLDDELLVAKVEALRAHESQMTPLFDAYGDDFMRALASHEVFRDATRAVHGDVRATAPVCASMSDGPQVLPAGWGRTPRGAPPATAAP